ncbi:SpoIID/LytB domain-containing protein [Rossellomorea aquimaris]|uniref:SpoIID/LytB domain-containing protein n=1 Tax=Rossellomorea aquimaris TaxID=189382 RepID=UPI0007D08A77|nr:SpoIID/LytB domain-containing protein [Rossellomorea aquimaris]
MKKFGIVSFILLLMVSLPLTAMAADPVKYSNQVDVNIKESSSVYVSLKGSYQLVNLDTQSIEILPVNTTVYGKKTSSGVQVDYQSKYQTSAKGFDIQEIPGNQKIAIFTLQSEMKKGASSGYPTIKTFSAGDSATYIQSFTNSLGETWYNVTSGSSSGWVLGSTTQLQTISGLSLVDASDGRTYRGSFLFSPSGTNVKLINYLGMEDYLKGVLPNEMPASWHTEALKAQAIAARSYAYSTKSTLSNTVASQVYKGYSSEDSRTNAAVEATKDLKAVYGGKPIQTFFYSTSGGKTANISDVWNTSQQPYYTSVADTYENSPHSNWTQSFTPNEILKSFGVTKADTVLYDMSLSKTGANGEVSGVTLTTSDGVITKTGNENTIRKLFPISSSSSYGMIKSNWFDTSLTKSKNAFVVQTASGQSNISSAVAQTVQTKSGQVTLSNPTYSIQTNSGVITSSGITSVTDITLNGKGFGHRIGMSQYGAKGFAENGWNAEKIITHYFQGSTVSK